MIERRNVESRLPKLITVLTLSSGYWGIVMSADHLLQPENHTKKYEALFVEIDSGRIKIPQFQRDFVWDKEQSARLIDSIIKGYPVGTFIFWKTRDELRAYREIGNFTMPKTPKGDFAEYVLDGQQRITSLYAIRKGLRITRENKIVDYKDIYIDLDQSEQSDEQIVVSEPPLGHTCVSVHSVLNEKMGFFYKNYESDQAEVIERYKGRLINYDFSCITIKDYPIDIATEVFSRINTGGKTLTVFEIMVAKTYDEIRDFDLVARFEELRDGIDEENGGRCLRTAIFETIPESVVIQAVGALSGKKLRSRDILKIKRDAFIDTWPMMKDALFSAVDFVRQELRVPVSHLMPYPSMTVPLAYFFEKTGSKKPTKRQRALIEQWFYWTAFTYRYSSGAEAKIIDDLNRMDLIATDESPAYPPHEIFCETEWLKTWEFSAGDAVCKLVLCLFAFREPKSFDTNGIVTLDNSNLKIATSRNYHHFFPKAFLAKHKKDAIANLMVNITLIDGYSNKHRIRDKSPSAYITRFAKDNPDIDETLKSHLIMDREKFGINDNDYDAFVIARAREIARQLTLKLDPFKTRKVGQ